MTAEEDAAMCEVWVADFVRRSRCPKHLEEKVAAGARIFTKPNVLIFLNALPEVTAYFPDGERMKFAVVCGISGYLTSNYLSPR